MKNKLGILLLSIAIAFGLWLYVTNYIYVEGTNTIPNVPVVFQNEGALTSRGLMITGGFNQTVTLTITGKRSEVNSLSNVNLSVQVDLSRIYDTGIQSVGYTVNYPGNISAGDMSYETQHPRLQLTIEERVEKNVPVKVITEGNVDKGYVADDANAAVLSTRYVKVTGPASVVNHMDYAVVRVNLDGQKSSIDQDYPYELCKLDDKVYVPVEIPNPDHVVMDTEQVHVNLTILRYKELEVGLNIIDGGGATAQTATIVYDHDKLMISGSEELLNTLGTRLILGTIDLGQIKEDTKLTFPVVLPEEVNNLTNVTQIEVTVSFPNLVVKEFSVKNIVPINVPSGMVPKVVTQQIKVTVRGPRSQVLQMTPEDITVTVDFADMLPGSTMNKLPTVTFSSDYPDVGLLNWDKVVISLEEPVIEPTEPDPTGPVDPAAETEPTESTEPND